MIEYLGLPDFPALVKPDSVISIPLTQGERAYFNARHWELIEPHSWRAIKGKNTFYAITSVPRPGGKQGVLLMHRLVLGIQSGDLRIDHADGNGCNNLDNNIRVATTRQNGGNLRNKERMSSRYTGVCWHGQRQKWRAYITIDGGQRHLGLFDTEEGARDAYLAAMYELGDKPL